jgi:S1-C subfamily serine protease
MNKTITSIGGIAGAGIIIFIILFSFQDGIEISTPELIVSNGHDTTKIGEAVSSYQKNNYSLTEIFESSESGVVRVNVERNDPTQFSTGGVGSGFVYDDTGNIITNDHVVYDAKKITVTFVDGEAFLAEIIGSDPYTDIAVIKINSTNTLLNPLPIGNSNNLRVGEQVATIGNPFGLSGSMTSGIVSQIGRLLPQQSGYSIPDVIQTDAAINPGNSGGPLLNMDGDVIGINTAIQSATGEFAGIGFAVPSATVKKIVPVLIETGEFKHPWIGIQGHDVDPELAKIRELNSSKGFLIMTVIEDSPADVAGLLGVTETVEIDEREYPLDGDIIISVDGIEVRKISDILVHLQRNKVIGDYMELEILRDGQILDITIMLEERRDN